nr:zinc finger MYM-type protein 1-like [Parasteatoda tepidariorum]XP_042895119.1 zinc finger MYM-type protein 1-like [Parasteatoda tepidariorum]XP_042899228.1 zinc finger MYM-type protein 1-like [Parasteatoda tepidariorum]XP_042901855.1 zinc finger MYM-type protein 1-like [Parasteatoda tepidariorum]XP_042906919.1 zinc finger MYM-type protein 1-like [Parasteatoda tepidariorum]XP_042909334.1 zinc finger MYM-type protein 1-like [Parasteatoda tepidariorum]
MSKRSYPSGSEKRKKALHQKEVIEKLPKLTSYFTTTTGETSVSSNQLINVPHDDSAQLQIAGISKPSCSNFEKEIESESDYSYDESATTSVTSLKPTTPTVSIEQQFSNTEELISHDPADYFHEKFVEINREILIRKGPVYFQNKDSDFSEASRTYKDGNKLVTRYFNKALFIRKLKNNESVERKWLLYSPSKCSVFCFSCCLFNPTDVNLCSRNGCNDWKHINHIILTHENSPAHKQSMMTYLARSKAVGRVDIDLLSQHQKEVDYWRNVLKRIVAVVKFLASRGLPFRGDNEILGSPNNGNYLGCVELLSEFDPFLADHLKKFGNPGKAKYFSISVDSTPDLSHIDQLTFIIRYVKDCVPVERFLKFIPIKEHKSKYLAETILNFLEIHDIPIKDCRGQSYDNASNMSGKYSGLQTRIKEKCEFATFIPCAGHSLNLVGVHAAGCVPEASQFFEIVQKVYNFFSGSTHRWNMLTEHLGSKKVVKSLSQTRWSARADAVSALHGGYKRILEALITIANDTEQARETRDEALSLSRKMGNLEFIILTEIWSTILERIDKTSNYLQKETITLDVATNLLTSLYDFITNLRDKFDNFESSAKENNPESDYKDLSQRTRRRSSRQSFFDGSAPSVQLNGKERFNVETFLPIIDTLSVHLKQRQSSYEIVSQRFSLFFHLKTLNSEEIRQGCKEFSQIYHEDVNEKELEIECQHLKEYLINVQSENEASNSVQEVYNLLKQNKIEDTFPNVEIALRIFLSMMVTNCSGERSFSKLKRIKNELRSTMLQERLNSLSLMSIECDILNTIDFEEVINDFAHLKSRRVPLQST